MEPQREPRTPMGIGNHEINSNVVGQLSRMEQMCYHIFGSTSQTGFRPGGPISRGVTAAM